MIEWDNAFRRDLDLTNWIESDMRRDYAHLLADHADLAVGKGYLELAEKFLKFADQQGIPFVLKSAREERARLRLDYSITGFVDEEVERGLEALATDLTKRSRITCERCGDPGQPQLVRGGIDAHKVLCSTCQRMYDHAVFHDELMPTYAAVIREFVTGWTKSYRELHEFDLDAYLSERLPKAGRKRRRTMIKICVVEIHLAIMRPDRKRRWWQDD